MISFNKLSHNELYLNEMEPNLCFYLNSSITYFRCKSSSNSQSERKFNGDLAVSNLVALMIIPTIVDNNLSQKSRQEDLWSWGNL